MPVKIRLTRMGKKKQPTYRVVVVDSRKPRDGAYIEQIGRYDPRQQPSLIEIDNDRALDWLSKGAQPTERAQKLLEISGAWTKFRIAKGDIHTIAAETKTDTATPEAADDAPVVVPGHTPEVHVVGGAPEPDASADDVSAGDAPAEDAPAAVVAEDEPAVAEDVAEPAATEVAAADAPADDVVADGAADDVVAEAVVEAATGDTTADEAAAEAAVAEATSEPADDPEAGT